MVRETDSLKIYNDNLEKVVMDQRAEVVSINEQLRGLEETNRGDRAPDAGNDRHAGQNRRERHAIPAGGAARHGSNAYVIMMDQADVTASEKYRRVMEAYQGEMEYGRTTEAYAEALPTTGQTVDFLRVGRTLLVYQSSDQVTTGWFNPATRQYEDLPERYSWKSKRAWPLPRMKKHRTWSCFLCLVRRLAQ